MLLLLTAKSKKDENEDGARNIFELFTHGHHW